MPYRFLLLDVFTDTLFGGNRLAVLPDANGLDERSMQAIAAEFGFPESTFVLPSSRPQHDCRVRIFTPRAEMPFAGHPTIGTALALATLGRVHRQGARARVVMEQLAGTVPVDIAFEADRPVDAELTAPERPTISPGPSLQHCAELLTLEPADLVASHVASTGAPFLIVEAADGRIVGRSRVPSAERAGLLQALAVTGVLLFARERNSDARTLHARMFAPLWGVPEDPATGSAAAALAGLLATTDAASDGWHHWRIEQGIEMQRPSLIRARALREGGRVAEVRVAGGAVRVAEGTIHVPQGEGRKGVDDVAA